MSGLTRRASITVQSPEDHQRPDLGIVVEWRRWSYEWYCFVLTVIDRPSQSPTVLQRWYRRTEVAPAPTASRSPDPRRWLWAGTSRRPTLEHNTHLRSATHDQPSTSGVGRPASRRGQTRLILSNPLTCAASWTATSAAATHPAPPCLAGSSGAVRAVEAGRHPDGHGHQPLVVLAGNIGRLAGSLDSQ